MSVILPRVSEDDTFREFVDKINDTMGAVEDTNQNIESEVSRIDSDKATKAEVEVERQRINNLTSLPEGSTTGDAELMDIRVGADGIVYPTAGEAVRGQVGKLSDEKSDKFIYNKFETVSASNSYYSFFFKKGHTYLIKNNSENAGCNISSIKSESNRVIVEEIVKGLPAGEKILFTISKEAEGIYIYTSDKSIIEITDLTVEEEYNIVLGKNSYFDVTLYGVTSQKEDNKESFILMLDKLPKDVPLILFFPPGVYKFEKSNERINLPNKCILKGDNATIFFNDTENEGVSLFKPGKELFGLDGITFLSTFDKIRSGLNPVYLAYGESTKTVIVRNCSFSFFRTICININNCFNALIENNDFSFMGRDCIRLLNTKTSIVRNNAFDHCGDDVVAFTQVNQNTFSDYGHLFYNNRLSYSMGVCYLGCSNVKIYNNKFIRYLYIAKFGQSTELETEGGTSYNIEVSNNLFQNPLYCANVGQGRFACRMSYVRDLLFCNNTFLKNENIETVDSIIFIENWFTNVTCDNFLTIIACPNDTNERITFRENYFNNTFDSEKNARLITGNVPRWFNLINNFFTQLKAIPLNIPYKTGKVIDNYFGFTVTGISQAFFGTPTVNKRNVYDGLSGYVGDNDNIILNKTGITVSPNLDNIKVDSDGVIENYKKTKSISIPTQGYYFKGDIVYNISSSNILCWKRLTDGNTHVLGVDWKEISYN